jgi:hypothetical protein
MFQWLRELNDILRERRVCNTCEVLRIELEKERREKQSLLDHILTPRTQEPQVQTENPQPVFTPKRPWRMVQKELELKDRAEHQRILREVEDKIAAKPVDSSAIQQLEKNLGIPNG